MSNSTVAYVRIHDIHCDKLYLIRRWVCSSHSQYHMHHLLQCGNRLPASVPVQDHATIITLDALQ